MSAPLVSVIVPAHNGRRHLAEALASVAAQTHPAVECIVVDDGSTDGSAAIARAAPGVRVVVQPNAGVAVARNTAVALARGTYFAFLDQDDRFEADKLARQLAALEADPAAGFALVHERIELEDGTEFPTWIRRPPAEGHQPSFIPGSWLIPRATLRAVGCFDASYISGSDTDWLLRARERGLRPVVVPAPLLVRRVHAANNSHDLEVLRAEHLRAVRQSARRRGQAASP